MRKIWDFLLDTGNLTRNSEESRNSTFGLIPEVVKPRTNLVLLNTEVNNPVNSPHRNMHKKNTSVTFLFLFISNSKEPQQKYRLGGRGWGEA